MRARSSLGLLVPFKMIEVDMGRASARLGRYVPTPKYWHELECLRRCYAEIPAGATDASSRLTGDPLSGVWMVFFTEFVEKCAVYLMWDVYHNCRLLHLNATVISHLRIPDVSTLLRGRETQEELLRISTWFRRCNGPQCTWRSTGKAFDFGR